MMATVTAVIPYFNGMRTIERALASIERQSVAPVEVIIVNDGSDRENAEFVHELAKRGQFRVIDRPNGGQGAARNEGIRAAATPLVSLLDQDDFYTPDHIEKLLAVALAQNPSKLGFIYSDVSRGTSAGTITVNGVIASSGIAHPIEDIRSMLARDIMILPSSMLLHKENILDLGGFDERFVGFEDDDLVIRCALAGLETSYLPEPLTVWTLNPESASFSPRMSESRWLFFNKLVETFTAHEQNLIGEVIAPRFVRSFIGEYVFSLSRSPAEIDAAHARIGNALAELRKTGRRIPPSLAITATLVASTPRALLAPLYALYERIFRPSPFQRTP
jgi:glycosyltransferase involved in cell wall biosynthesis